MSETLDGDLEMGPAGNPITDSELAALETLTAIGRPFGARAATEIRRLRALVRRLARTAHGRRHVIAALRRADGLSKAPTDSDPKESP